MKANLAIPCLAFLALPNTVWSAGESCNSLLNLGLYNVSQSSNASDAQAMALSSFCSYDYSRSDLSSGQSAAIEGSYGIFSAGASGSASKSEIVEKQKSVCASGFNSTAYSNTASAYSRTVYQGTLDAWNKCQALANKGLVFEIQPSSTLQGVSVIITAPTGLSAKFLGVSQYGVGRSDCNTTANGKLLSVGPSSPFDMTAASKVTVNCTRKMESKNQDLLADAQDLAFVTSADTLTLPLAAIGSLARATADQVKSDAIAKAQSLISQALDQPTKSIKALESAADQLRSETANLKGGLAWGTHMSPADVAVFGFSNCPASVHECIAAAHRHCVHQGYKGGYPQEFQGGGNMDIVCVK